jgi:N utilization substance protein A
MVRLVDPVGQHAHVLVPPDQLSLAIGREGQNVRLAARLTGWKIDIKNAADYDQASEDARAADLIALREEDERQQAEAEARLAVEQAARAEEDARLRELYPLPEDEEGYDSDAEAGAGEAESDDEAEPAAQSEALTADTTDPAAAEPDDEAAVELR